MAYETEQFLNEVQESGECNIDLADSHCGGQVEQEQIVQSRFFFTSLLAPAENCSEPPAILLICPPQNDHGPAAIRDGFAVVY